MHQCCMKERARAATQELPAMGPKFQAALKPLSCSSAWAACPCLTKSSGSMTPSSKSWLLHQHGISHGRNSDSLLLVLEMCWLVGIFYFPPKQCECFYTGLLSQHWPRVTANPGRHGGPASCWWYHLISCNTYAAELGPLKLLPIKDDHFKVKVMFYSIQRLLLMFES